MYSDKVLRLYQGNVLWCLLRGIDEAPGETFTVMFPRQSGKNEISAWLVVNRLIGRHRDGGSVVVVAPTLNPQAQISFERTLRHLRPWASLNGVRFGVEGNTIRCGAATATFLSGSPDANVAGHTASALLIGDEAQDLDEDWFNRQFRPMTASTGAPIVLFGTPWQGDSLLEKAVERNRTRDAEMAASAAPGKFTARHYEVAVNTIDEEAGGYERFVEQQRELLGGQHPIFLSQYELRASAGAGRLLGEPQLRALEGAFPGLDMPSPGERYCAGLDLAGEGADGDASVLTVARMDGRTCEVVAVWRWRGHPFAFVQDAVARLAREWSFERLLCDASGMGAPITATLRAALGDLVDGFTFTERSKSELGFELLAAAGTGTLRIAQPTSPGLQALWSELRACRVDRRQGGTIGWSAPGREHDDCVASLALCLRAGGSLGPPRVAHGRSRTA